MRHFNILTALFAVILALTGQAGADIRIGVLAPAGEALALRQWAPVADAVSERLGAPVTLTAAPAARLMDQIEGGAVDVVIGNPVQAALAVTRQAASPIVSVRKRTGVMFGGVIIVHPGSGIATATDLRGKTVATLPPAAAGGYLFQAHYLIGMGLDVPGDFGKHVVARNQADMVRLVARGVFDAAFVRTGMVERLIAEGAVAATDVVILDRKETPGFPEAHTTELYPEWMVFGSHRVDAGTLARLRTAFLGIRSGDGSLTAAGVEGFEPPHDLRMVVDALIAVGTLDPSGS